MAGILQPCRDYENGRPHDYIYRPISTNREWYVSDRHGNRLAEHGFGMPGVPETRTGPCNANAGMMCTAPCPRRVCGPHNNWNRPNARAIMDWVAAGVCNLCADEIRTTMQPGDDQCDRHCPRRRWVAVNNAAVAERFCLTWASSARPPTNGPSSNTRARANGVPIPAPRQRWHRLRGRRQIPLCACGRGEANHERRVINTREGVRDGARFRRCMACFIPPPDVQSGGFRNPGPARTGIRQRFIYLPDTRPHRVNGSQIPYWDDDNEYSESEDEDEDEDGADDENGDDADDGDDDAEEDEDEESDGASIDEAHEAEMDDIAAGMPFHDEAMDEEDLLDSPAESDSEIDCEADVDVLIKVDVSIVYQPPMTRSRARA